MGQSRLQKLFSSLERIILRLLVVGLVLLVAVQFILVNTGLEERLAKQIPWAEKVLSIGRQQRVNQPASRVFSTQIDARSVGELEFSLPKGSSNSELKLLVNDRVVANFAHSTAEIEVKPGDEIAVDARQVNQGLWLKLDSVSASLLPFKAGDQFWIKKEYKVLGRVVSRDKF